jgi:hypothetical protein
MEAIIFQPLMFQDKGMLVIESFIHDLQVPKEKVNKLQTASLCALWPIKNGLLFY